MDELKVDMESWPHRRSVMLDRFIFATRFPLALPHGFSFTGPLEALGTGDSTDDINWVSLTIHQVTGGRNQSLRAADAVMNIAGIQSNPSSQALESPTAELVETWTVVEAMTPQQIAPTAEPDGPTYARHWTEDSIMRVVFALQHLARAERLRSVRTNSIPTYEQVMSPVHAQSAAGQLILQTDASDSRALATIPPADWGAPQLVWLEHSNLAVDSVQVRPDFDQWDPVMHQWLVHLELKLPGALWRERILDARQQLNVEGRYDLAIILFATATEVLLDGLLQMLWWEKSLQDSETTAATVAADFDRTRDSLDRTNRFLIPLVGGNWASPDGPLQTWRRQTYALRHQCVHGGYYPTASEAIAASAASDKIATFLFDRIGARRRSFPRTCIMALGQSGLESRNQWDGILRRFSQQEAQHEGNWALSLKAFRDNVNALRRQ